MSHLDKVLLPQNKKPHSKFKKHPLFHDNLAVSLEPYFISLGEWMKLRMNLRQISVITAMLLLVISFQNCGKFSQTPVSTDSSSTSSGSGSSTSGSGTNGGTTATSPSSPTSPTNTLTATEKTNRCYAGLSASGPVLKSLSATSLEVGSGLGITNSGDVNSAQTTASIDLKVSDPVPFADTTLACESLISASLKCTVDTVILNKAIDFNGVDVSSQVTLDKDKMALIEKAIDLQQCRVQLDSSKATWANPSNASVKTNVIKSQSGMANSYRCVDATFNLKIAAHIERNDNKVGYDSNKINVTMRIRNNCAPETSIKPGYDLPTLSYYGGSVAIDGNWAVVVATQENDPSGAPIEIGAAYMYNYDGTRWVFKQRIQSAGAGAKDTISAVALKGSSLVLGSAYNSGMGSITLYQLSGSTWQQIGPAVGPSDAQAGQTFGASLALDGSTLAVGSPLYSGNSGALNMSGAVSIYDVSSSGLSFKQLLTAGDSVANRGFGTSVALSGNNLIVGAPQAKGKESSGIGDVFIFQKTTSWNLLKTMSNTGLDKGSRFGASVDISGLSVLIGIPGKSSATTFNIGQVQYFSDFNSAAKTNSWDGNGANDYYGSQVKVTADKVFIGAPYRDTSTGQIEVRPKSDLTKVQVIRPINSAANDRFGTTMAISGSNVLVGAYAKKDPQISSGAAFLYLVP